MSPSKFILHGLTAVGGLAAAVQAYHHQQDYGYQRHDGYGVGSYGHQGSYGGLNSRDIYDEADYYFDRRDLYDDEQYYNDVLFPRYLDALLDEYLETRGIKSAVQAAGASVKKAASSLTAKPEQSKPFNNKEGAIQKAKSVPMQGTKEGVTGIGELVTKKLGDHAATSWKNARIDALSTGYKNSAGTGLSKNQRQSLRNQAALDMYKDD